MKKRGENRFDVGKRAQVTIFIILAIIIVAAIAIYFVLRGGIGVSGVSKELKQVYDTYLGCIEQHAKQGISIMSSQGGYIKLPEFVPGSAYRPYSSQLDFFGQPVAYWMYVSGNNLLREQIPTKSIMESQLADYIKSRMSECDFSSYNQQGFDVLVAEEGDVGVKINNLDVSLSINNNVAIYFEDKSAIVNKHSVSVSSKLGKFYDLALETYNYEKKNMFLEDYALDALRGHAPVDGVELTCSPKVFIDETIKRDLSYALSETVNAMKLKGNYYTLSNKENSYFVTDIGRDVDESVNFIYSTSWPSRIEIYGDRVANPIGLQQGMAVLGFCYVPYHLVYDVDFPVLVQYYDSSGEIFQFAMSVIIDKNQARQALPTTAGTLVESEVCRYKNQKINVRTYDASLNPVEARIKLKCINEICDIGKTENVNGEQILTQDMPSCLNGFILATAEGYADTKYQISTNEESEADIIMKKKFKINLDLGSVEKAVVNFNSVDYSTSVLYPEMKSVDLIEGAYNISVYAYRNSSLTFPAINDQRCVKVPAEGLGGVFGVETDKCFDINVPEVKVEMAVVGGGKNSDYFTEDQLGKSGELNINVPMFGVPIDINGLQINYAKAEAERVYLTFE
ncbi:MAG: hypothetical protein WCP89_00440 [archaeon]